MLPLPAGTTVAVEAGDTTPTTEACTIDKLFGTTVNNIAPQLDPTVSLTSEHRAILKNCTRGDVLSVKVKVPSGLETVVNFTVQ